MKYRSKEQSEYAKLISACLRPGPALLAGAAAGIGKTHGFTIPLVESGKKVAIAFSTRQLISQFLESDALAQAMRIRACRVLELRPKSDFPSSALYSQHKADAAEADLLLLTHAGAIIDSFAPSYARLRDRDVILFDEADLLADAADLRSTFAISSSVQKECKADNLEPLQAAKMVLEQADADEDRAAALAILNAFERPAWYKVVGRDDDGSLTLKHRMPGRMLRRLVEESKRCIFTSGTLYVSGSPSHFVKAIGLQSIAPESRHIDPILHGTLDIDLATEEMTIEAMAARISATQRPTIVLTTSHEMTAKLGALCDGATIRQPGEPLADALARCPDDGIFIAAGAWSGVDLPRLRWKTVVIPKTPFQKPSILDGQQVAGYLDSKVVAIRRTNQGLHRGLRTPVAHCTLLLLDPRSGRDDLKQAIPSRFSINWNAFEEGSLVVRAHLAYERTRSAALKKAAIAHYGAKCSREGCSVTDLHRLDVHHTKPIAEGERKTTLDEVEVLCANHHRDAHHEMRMANLAGEDA